MRKMSLNLCLLTTYLVFFSKSLIFSQDNKPNIVVFLLDDAGYNDFGFQGSNIAITPNIDELAGEGTIFTQGYVTNSVCSPSRAGMLSGQYQNKFGYEYNNNSTIAPVAPGHNQNDAGIDLAIPTMGNYLQELGYNTALFGKWHLGERNRHRPNRRGFDHFYGLIGGSRSYNRRETLDRKVLWRNEVEAEPSTNNFYLTDLLTDDALEYMRDQLDSGTPFLTFMSYTAPHGPYQAKPEDKALFDNIERLNDDQKHYYGMIKNVDDNVKRIVDLLKNRGVYDNTLFVFLSDNGGKRSVSNNGPLRRGKSSQFEGGLRVPFFTTWKNNIPSGNTYDNQVISLDLTTTFIKAAGGDLSDDRYYELDGKDLVAAVNDNIAVHDILYWRKKNFWFAVSDGTNKVIIDDHQDNGIDGRVADTLYYNLATDISEVTNLYPTNRSSVSDLVESYDSWSKKLDLPSWVQTSRLPKSCRDRNIKNPQDCPEIVDEYSAFAANTRLTEVARQQINVSKAGTIVLNKSVLEYIDSIKSPAVITYRLDVLPNQGSLLNSGIAMQVGDRFRQLDINKGKITYQHTGADISSDSFSFSVNDGSGHENYRNLSLSINISDSLKPAYSGEWEAEEATLLGSAQIRQCSSFSAGEAVRGIQDGNDGENAVVFDHVNMNDSGQYDLTLSYISTDPTTMDVEVNDVIQTINVPATGRWCYQGGSPGVHTITINLNSGMNIIKVYSSPILDKIKLESSDSSKQVSTFSNSQLVLYSNPIIKGDVIQMAYFNTEGEISSLEDSVHSTIMDVSGKTILRHRHNRDQGNRIKIPTSSLERGVYFLKVRISNRIYVQHVLIR